MERGQKIYESGSDDVKNKIKTSLIFFITINVTCRLMVRLKNFMRLGIKRVGQTRALGFMIFLVIKIYKSKTNLKTSNKKNG